jgi:hypothetical protein
MGRSHENLSLNLSIKLYYKLNIRSTTLISLLAVARSWKTAQRKTDFRFVGWVRLAEMQEIVKRMERFPRGEQNPSNQWNTGWYYSRFNHFMFAILTGFFIRKNQGAPPCTDHPGIEGFVVLTKEVSWLLTNNNQTGSLRDQSRLY